MDDFVSRSGPSWVMCGFEPAPGHVVLLASKDLTQAELEERADDFRTWYNADHLRTYPSRREYTLSTTMRSFVKIVATDWPSAFNSLFQRWTPEADQHPQLEAQHALEPGTESGEVAHQGGGT